ncbi:MAG: hypothetical protein KF871_12770 [Hydrogenophaga sp.]|uniref:hypothetical protein n=1 Tax=Hydrogenophaga sp. TaxID=1904254 RepID=UPI001D68C997|nr:hypothetical protein [Hydrogenophaga sp.]MBX3610760.1 hypothetical protein [Hydrogenophaga sp.]
MNFDPQNNASSSPLPFSLTRQGAIDYIGVKPSYFDAQIRPQLTSAKAGTSVLFLREELEGVIRGMLTGDSKPQQEITQPSQATKSSERWERDQAASTKGRMANGSSTNSSKAYGFAKALNRLKTRTPG